MNNYFSTDQVQCAGHYQQSEDLLKERLSEIEQPKAYDYRLMASYYLNTRQYEEASSIQLQMLKLAGEEGNLDLKQSLYQDLGWTALLSKDPSRARRHFSSQRATLEALYDGALTRGVYRESDLNLFVAAFRLCMWSASRRHLFRLWQSFEAADSGFREFVIGRQETLNAELPDFIRLRTMVFLETLEQMESRQPTKIWSNSRAALS